MAGDSGVTDLLPKFCEALALVILFHLAAGQRPGSV